MLMLEKRSHRMENIQRMAAGDSPRTHAPARMVSDAEMFSRRTLAFPNGIKIKRVTKKED